MIDYYQILGISVSASPKEIVAAYRAKCKLLHPDVNPNADATAQMQMVNEAYGVLSNDALRRQYDYQYGYSETISHGTCSGQERPSGNKTYSKKWWEKEEPSWYEDMIKWVFAANVLRLIIKALFNLE